MSKDLIAATEADIKKMEGMLKTVAPGAAKQDLTGELNAAKKALLEEKAILAQLETQVKATGGAHLTLRTQLRQMKEELVGMEAAGKVAQQSRGLYRNDSQISPTHWVTPKNRPPCLLMMREGCRVL